MFKITYLIRKDVLIPVAVLGILVLRLLFIGIMGLMPQDAYYNFYSEHLALSYFDHPPAIAYMLHLFTSVLGKKVFVLKLADTVITLASIISFYCLARKFLGRYRAPRAVLLFFSTFMVTVLSLVSTPDIPLMLFWCLSLLSLYQAVFVGKNLYWVVSGLLMGLAFDSKYTGIFLPAGIVLFLLLSGTYRKLLFNRWFGLCVLTFLLTISPVILWNVKNDFASFRFQGSARVSSMEGFHINVLDFLGVVGHQAAILMPVLFFALVTLVFKLLKKYKLRPLRMPPQKLFLLCFFVPVFAGFFCISFIYWVKLNWMMPAYITGIILIAGYLSGKLIRYQLVFSFLIHLILAIEILYYPVEVKSDDTWVGWKELAKQVQQLRGGYREAFVFSADDYKTSAVLDFYLGNRVYGMNVIGERALQFDFVGYDLNELKGSNALFINSIPNFKTAEKENNFPASLPAYFDSITELNPILIKKDGRMVRKFLVFYCRNYHPRRTESALVK